MPRAIVRTLPMESGCVQEVDVLVSQREVEQRAKRFC